jgi:hypothetical protein
MKFYHKKNWIKNVLTLIQVIIQEIKVVNSFEAKKIIIKMSFE